METALPEANHREILPLHCMHCDTELFAPVAYLLTKTRRVQSLQHPENHTIWALLKSGASAAYDGLLGGWTYLVETLRALPLDCFLHYIQGASCTARIFFTRSKTKAVAMRSRICLIAVHTSGHIGGAKSLQ